ncbi:MAG: S41 family peptidase [Patescibacteria group bacterium]|nr:S41 family peptidase [Patescibacteria group bacterium]MDE2116473.1 S41 family peptidase [Patescibacteria group bacterium]
MHTNPSKRVSFSILAVVAIILAFAFGWHEGQISVPAENLATAIVNKDEAKPASVDFSLFWKAWNIIQEKYVGTSTSDQDKVYGAIQGMVSSLGDPYTVFFPPTESKIFASEIAGNFDGVGMEVGIQNGKLVVVAPIKGSPADKAGVKPGDVILKIDDKISSGMSADEAVNLIRGKAGTPVTLTLGRANIKVPIVVTIIRQQIDLPEIDTQQKGDVFVISLYSFSENSADLFRQALKQFVDSGDHKLVIDLRGNPGGYLDAAVDMASWFLPAGDVVVREDFGKGQPENIYRSKGYDIFTNKLHMVILVDGGTASAAEILSGALSQNGKAALVGEKTFGKGSVQELVDLSPDTSLKVTIAKWLTPNGTWISNQGITPDYVVPITDEQVKNGQDPQMDKALQLLSQQP